MHRIFLGLAVTDGTLLVASLAVGFGAANEPRGPHESWHGVHLLLGLVTMLATLLVHSIAFTYFLGTTRWVKEVVQIYGMPEWVHAQALRNKRRAFPFELGSMVAIALTTWAGGAVHTRDWPIARELHLAAATLTIGFNLGAYVAEYLAIVAQARLLLEVKARADRQRAGLATGP